MKIFISYSHKNEEWKNRLEEELKVFELDGNLDIWSDSNIQTGADWLNEIQNAIEQSHIAILLISTAFLISDFIRKKEIPHIIQKKERDGLIVFPVIIEPCNWNHISWLESIQVQPKNGKPLMSFSECDRKTHLSELAKTINSIFPIPFGQLNNLKEILTDVDIPSVENLKHIYQHIFSDTPGLFEIPKTHNNNSRIYLFHLLDQLALRGKNIKNRIQTIPIIDFVIHLRKLIENENIKKKLVVWAVESGKRFDLTQQDIEKLIYDNQSSVIKSTTMQYLLMRIEEKKEEGKYSIQAWFYRDKETIVNISEDMDDQNKFDLDNIMFDEVPLIIGELLEHINDYFGIQRYFIGIELFLPLEQINLEVDHWSFDTDIGPIAAYYPMVVRVKERYEKTTKKLDYLFKYYWKSQNLRKNPTDCVIWLDEPDIKGLRSKLRGGSVFLALNFVPEKDFLNQLIKMGVPFILWPRKIYNEKEIKDLRKLTCCQYVENVPELLFKERLNLLDFSIDTQYITKHISLLWDNYDRKLPEPDFVINAMSL